MSANNTCQQQKLYKNVQSGFTHNSQLGNRQGSFKKENKLWYNHTMAHYLAIKRNQLLVYVIAWIKKSLNVERTLIQKSTTVWCHSYEVQEEGN